MCDRINSDVTSLPTGTQMAPSTTGQLIKKLKPGEFLRVDVDLPSGALEARKLSDGSTKFYWRYSFEKKTRREHIGLYDSAAAPKSLDPTARGYSIAAARRAAEEMARLHLDNLDTGGYEGIKQVKRDARAAAEAEAERVRAYTLRRLLNAYSDYLERQGKSLSAQDTRSLFKVHIYTPFPALADSPASKVTQDDVAAVLRRIFEGGKNRTAGKLRSYLMAAYNLACDARLNAVIPMDFKEFGLKSSPLERLPVGAGASKSAKNPLSTEELQLYWRLLQNVPGFRGALLRFHLLTGAQRAAQLVRLLTRDIKDGTITLYDTKGRPRPGVVAERPWQIPLTERAKAALAICDPRGVYAFPSQTGRSDHTGAVTLSDWAKEVAKKHIPGFQLKRLRSGVETLLARNGVSNEVRGYLQSHGNSGVQSRHYNAYEYEKEKLAALTKLEELLTAPTPKRTGRN